jgi:hypothetical protein
MFLVQGVLSEKLMGKPWEQNVKENIFNPLGMSTSNFSVRDMAKVSDASLGYDVIRDSVIKQLDYYDINAMGPAGSINSNVTEMANWVITWINGGKFKGKEILPADYVRQAMSSQMVVGAALPDKEVPDAFLSNYGFGWFLSSYRGHYRVEHGGNIDGFSASTSFYPSDSIGIFVLTNQNGSAVPGIVRNTIADRLLGLNRIDWNKRTNDAQAKAKAAAKDAEKNLTRNKKQGTKPSHKTADYEGLFNNPGYGTIEIYSKDDSLFFRSRNGDAWLRHYHYDVFDLFQIDKKDGIDTTEQSPVNLQFHMNLAGDIDMLSMPIQAGLKDIEFGRIPRPKEIAKADLQKFVGEYELGPGAIAKFYIKGEKTLCAFIEGQPEYELVPTEKDKFELKILKGYSVQFEENNKGEIIAASFIQPNGTFKATRKK